jgi:hypothetical protein
VSLFFWLLVSSSVTRTTEEEEGKRRERKKGKQQAFVCVFVFPCRVSTGSWEPKELKDCIHAPKK